uniref:AlNc14C104G6144 protein n=1 Tax=Albugo laibachii Nc14 TaxID=890382 RepID=F0WHT7_9STRA|nr:AlNc14C104G6144 [Albugo laibachii Nc14]|eukprot:CCA20812.1 AlNc14C104G6144 [Albugo laibachii Nc14]
MFSLMSFIITFWVTYCRKFFTGAAISTDVLTIATYVSAGELMTRVFCHRSSAPALSRFASGKGASLSCICML